MDTNMRVWTTASHVWSCCMRVGDVCVLRVHVCGSIRVQRMLALGCYVWGRTRTCKHLFILRIIPERCLHIRPLIGRASFRCSTPSKPSSFQLNSKPCWDTAAAPPPPPRVRIRSSSTNSYKSSRTASYATCFLQHKL